MICVYTLDQDYSQTLQRTEVNTGAIESLAPRIKVLSESLSMPIPLGDVSEKEREGELEQSVHTVNI